MPAQKRPAALRSDATHTKKPRLAHPTGKKTPPIVSHGKTRVVDHTHAPSDSDNSTSEEDDDEQSPTLDEGHNLGPSGNN